MSQGPEVQVVYDPRLLPPGVATALVVMLGAVLLGLLVWGHRRVAETTLVAAWLWALLAATAVVTVEVLVHLNGLQAAWVSHARYLAATLTLCPGVALLGAKRPQHQAWQLIVASLWVVLVLPSAEGWLDRPGDPVSLSPARQVFVAGLAVLGWANYLGTRNFGSACWLLAGQYCLLAESLPLVGGLPGFGSGGLGLRRALALVLAVAGLGWAWRPGPRTQPGDSRIWREFRDLFGCLWAWRVAGRVNAWAQSQGLALRLGWEGWYRVDGRPPGETSPGLEELQVSERQLAALLRRFVSASWVSERSGGV